MNNLRRGLAYVAVTGWLVCAPGFAATAGAASSAAEAAVRKADMAWAASAAAGNVDAWLAFMTADAIQLLPGQPLASGTAAVRLAVGGLLSLPQVAVEWHATKVEIGRTGDLAHVRGTYALDHAEPGGAVATERGRVVEIWKRQADGTWKCGVASWTPDEALPAAATPTMAAPPAAAAPPGATTPTAAATPTAIAAPAVAAPAPPAAIPMPVTKYGDAPAGYLQAIRQYFQEHLKDPESIQYGEITPPQQGSIAGVSQNILMRETRDFGWIVTATINAKDARGTYVGPRTYRFLFRGERLIRAMAPLPSGEFRD